MELNESIACRVLLLLAGKLEGLEVRGILVRIQVLPFGNFVTLDKGT